MTMRLWRIVSFNNSLFPGALISGSDGFPITMLRGETRNSSRFVVLEFGFLDITTLGTMDSHSSALDINGHAYKYNSTGNLRLTLNKEGTFTVTGNSNNLTIPFIPLPKISNVDVELLNAMMQLKLVPYQDIPDGPGKTKEELAALGQRFFPFTFSSFQLAMSIYDWTSASFLRTYLFTHFVYTAMLGEPLDMSSIALMIWNASWGDYTPKNRFFMASFLMKPAETIDDLTGQLDEVAGRLRMFVDVQSRLICGALESLPRTSTDLIPSLYSGQVDVFQYTTSRFLPLFLEFPGNAGPTSVPLQMPLEDGIDTQLQPGKILTSKSFISFATSKQDGLNYSNGILLVLSPPTGALTWPHGAYVTPLSDNSRKIEYLLPPLSRFKITNTSWELYKSKKLLVLSLTLVGDQD